MAQLDRLKIQLQITSNEEDNLLLELLDVAKYAILSRRYPFGDFPVDDAGEPVLPARYLNLQARAAVYLYNKMGAEGQVSHSENGISRGYEPGDIPESLLKEVTPLVGTPINVTAEGEQ